MEEVNILTRINSDGILVSNETYVGTARNQSSGSNISNISIFYGGYGNKSELNIATRIDSTGIMVGVETTVGVARRQLAAGGI